MTGKELIDNIVAGAEPMGWLCTHFRPALTARGWRTPIQGAKGFPDVVLAKGGRVIFAEIKGRGDKLSYEQCVWLDTLAECDYPSTGINGVEVYLWEPKDWTSGLITDILTGQQLGPRPEGLAKSHLEALSARQGARDGRKKR